MKQLIDIFGKTISSKNNIENNLSISNTIFKNDNFIVVLDKNDNPRFESFHNKNTVYLPKKYLKDNPLYTIIIEKFNEDSLPKVITYHEFGHAAQVACVHNNLPIHIKGSSSEGDINYLFNGSSVPDKINNFLIKLFQEGFADCYSGLCLFKETGDIDVFKKISEFRSKRYDEIKFEKGKHFIHPNFNVSAAANMGKSVESFISNGKDIFKLPFTDSNSSIERYIERCVIAGCVHALIKELQTNDAFLKHFQKFNQEFKIDDSRIKDVIGNDPNLINHIEFEKQQGVASFFFELKKRLPDNYKHIIPSKLLKDLLTNETFKRKLDPNLELKEAGETSLPSGFEATKLKIISVRTNKFTQIKHNSSIKLN